MTAEAKHLSEICAVCVDMGTTNTRAWLMQGNDVVTRATDPVGIRNAASEGPKAIRECLRRVLTKLRDDPTVELRQVQPACVVAAGMIGSNLGLAEVPYVDPPATIGDLAGGTRWHCFADVSDLPVLLVPGIRSGPREATIDSINQIDVMRGEETLCFGLLAIGAISAPAIVINLGSHWKAIQIDRERRIHSSVTSLSGELLHAVQLHTVLAGSISRERPRRFSREWIEVGMREQRGSGLGRALFCARLLDLSRWGSPEDRLACVVGAFIASDLDGLLARGVIAPQAEVALVGHSAIAEAWQTALSGAQIAATIISQEQVETAMLEALLRILSKALPKLGSTSERARNG